MEPSDDYKKGKYSGRLEGALLGTGALFLIYIGSAIWRSFSAAPLDLLQVAASCLLPLLIFLGVVKGYAVVRRRMPIGSHWITPIAWAMFFAACLACIVLLNWMQGVTGYELP